MRPGPALRASLSCFVLFFCICTASAQTPGPEGHWEGSIELPGMPLAFDVDLARKDGAWSGDITIPAQGARDLPLADVTVDGRQVSFAIAGVPGDPKFAGSLAEDGQSVLGSFVQGGKSMPFTMKAAAAAAAKAGDALAGFDAVVEKALKDFEVPGAAVGIVVDGKVVLARGYGVRELGKSAPVTGRTLFAIGSATKAFTTFVLGQLVDEGRLDWDEPVASFLPGFRLYDRAATELITPRDLVTHRSGLPRHDLLWYNTGLSRKEMVERLRHLEPNETLRAKFQYNNAMFLTAGYLAEQLTGKTWEENVRERIFAPLGMSRSNFSVEDSQKSDDFAVPHSERKDKVQPIPFRGISNVGPAGSINSSVDDMTRWLLLHLQDGRVGEKSLINAATLADMHSPHMPTGGSIERPEISQSSYGLGWFIDTYRGHQRVHHGGGIDGFITMVTLFPQDRFGIVAFINSDQAGLPELLSRSIADRLLGLEPIDWLGESLTRRATGEALEKEAKAQRGSVRKSGTSPAHKLDEYAGRYEHPGYGLLEVRLRGKELDLVFNGITSPLEHWHYDVFNAAEGAEDPAFENTKLLFHTDVRGNVASVSVPFEPQVADIVFKKQPDQRSSDPGYLSRFAGDYELGAQKIRVELSGDTLTVNLPGQPQYHLVPQLGDEFVLKEYSIVSVRFETDGSGKVTGMRLQQPDGIYTAKRVEK